MSYKHKRPTRFLLIIVASAFLSSCKPAVDPARESSDRAAAEAEVRSAMVERERREAAEAEALARREQQQAALEEQRKAEAAKPQFSPQQLARAAQPKVWAPITVPDINVKAVFNSYWSDGQLRYRLALLGSSQGLQMFMRHRSYRINFADQNGNSIFDFPLAPHDFQWARPGSNGGIPTMETRGSSAVALSIYERAVQWNLTWYQ